MMMTMRKLLKTAAFAAGFAAAGAAYAAGDKGDVWDIVPCNSAGETLTDGWATKDAPLGAGEDVYFKIRLVRTISAGDDATNSIWRLEYTGLGSMANDWIMAPPRIGLYVNGKSAQNHDDWATLVRVNDASQEKDYYTTFVFHYKTRNGDFALPAVLMGDNGLPASELRSSGFLFDWGAWKVTNNLGETPNFARFDINVSYEPQYRPNDGLTRSADTTLSNAGIYVQTLDFDDAWEVTQAYADANGTNAVWRSVHENSTITIGTDPAIAMKAAASDSDSVVMYVWSDNTNAVTLADCDLVTFTNSFADASTPEIVTIPMKKVTISGGALKETFKIKGVTDGGKCNLVLSAFPGYLFSHGVATPEKIENYLTVPVQCVGKLPPTLYVERDDGTSDFSVTARTGTNSLQSVATLRVRLSQAYERDVQVTLEPGFTSSRASELAWSDYLAFSTTGKFPSDNTGAGSLTLTIPAGQTEISGRIYVFAKKTSIEVAGDSTGGLGGKIVFTPTVPDDISAEGIIEDYVGCTMSIVAQSADSAASPDGQDGALKIVSTSAATDGDGTGIAPTSNVPYPFNIQVEDVWAAAQGDGDGYRIRFYKRYNNRGEYTDLPGRYYYGTGGWLYRYAETTNSDNTVTYSIPTDTAQRKPPYITYTAPTGSDGVVSMIEVFSPVDDGIGQDGRKASVKFTAVVSDPKSATIHMYLNSAKDVDVAEVSEDSYGDDSVKLVIELSEADSTVFAYLEPIGDFDTNKIDTVGKSFVVGMPDRNGKLKGLQILSSGAKKSSPTTIKFLDGTRGGLEYSFRVLISDNDTIDNEQFVNGDRSAIRGDYGQGEYTITVNNVEPYIETILMNGGDEIWTAEGGADARTIPLGSEKTFLALVHDPGEYDLVNEVDGDKFQTRWRAYRYKSGGRDLVSTTVIDGDPNESINAFINKFDRGGKWEIVCDIRDKDMTANRFVSSATMAFTVLESPSVAIIAPSEVNENELSKSSPTNIAVKLDYFDEDFNGKIYVALKVTGQETNPGVLTLNSSYQWTTRGPEGAPFYFVNGVRKVYDETTDGKAGWYLVDFDQNHLERSISFADLDGTQNSRFNIEAFVAYTEEGGTYDTDLPSGGGKAAEYYLGDSCGIKVNNVLPEISIEAENTASNAYVVAGGAAAKSIRWEIPSDIDNDFTLGWWDNNAVSTSKKGILVEIGGNIDNA
ncbi:MAG: hypothetical protein IIT98_06595, partial [Kiritimatiellae bacterium]|nr:hypothetical protein [Kiritimatiellia bacterium]